MRTVYRPCVAVVQHSVRRYRAPFFEALRTRLAAADVGLRLLHSDHPAYLAPSPEQASLPWAEVRPGRRVWIREESLLWQPVLRDTRRARLVIVEQAVHLLVNYPLLVRQLLGGPPLAFWGHGRNFLLPAHGSTMAERCKRLLSRRAHWWFAYNDLAADAVVDTGFPPERITTVDNATDTRRLAAAVARADVGCVRDELGLAGRNVAVFAGTLGAVKRLEFLFAAADGIRERVPDFELVVVGNGMEEDTVAGLAAERPWARYAGPRFDDDLAAVLGTAKLLLVPAWAGLVVVDSFGAGVPLVASAAFPHPPEIAYLRDGVNGALVEDGGDPAVYADAVAGLLRDDERRAALVAGCEAAREQYSVETMADLFTEGVLQAFASARRR